MLQNTRLCDISFTLNSNHSHSIAAAAHLRPNPSFCWSAFHHNFHLTSPHLSIKSKSSSAHTNRSVDDPFFDMQIHKIMFSFPLFLRRYFCIFFFCSFIFPRSRAHIFSNLNANIIYIYFFPIQQHRVVYKQGVAPWIVMDGWMNLKPKKKTRKMEMGTTINKSKEGEDTWLERAKTRRGTNLQQPKCILCAYSAKTGSFIAVLRKISTPKRDCVMHGSRNRFNERIYAQY